MDSDISWPLVLRHHARLGNLHVWLVWLVWLVGCGTACIYEPVIGQYSLSVCRVCI
jgi:hypothetical protein